jgi:hypothetical protein
MCSLCPRKKPLPKKLVRFDSVVDTFSISECNSGTASKVSTSCYLHVSSSIVERAILITGNQTMTWESRDFRGNSICKMLVWLMSCYHGAVYSEVRPQNRPWRSRRGVDAYLYCFFNLGTRWVWWLTACPGRFTHAKETRYPLYRRLGGPVWTSAENLAHTGILFLLSLYFIRICVFFWTAVACAFCPYCGHSHWGRNVGWGFSRIRCWGGYLGPRGMRWRGVQKTA